MGRIFGMGELFSQEVAELADAMGVALYQYFSMYQSQVPVVYGVSSSENDRVLRTKEL